jgi:hypothetical protein
VSHDPSDLFIDTVQPKACRVISLPTRLWVLGGPAPTDSHEPPRSLRASFWRQAFNGVSRWSWLQSLDRPENYPGWWTCVLRTIMNTHYAIVNILTRHREHLL